MSLSNQQRFKIFSDPVHGFISVPKNLLMELIQTPEVQRLRRIRQLGVGHLVFPGAEHTRFNHALGALALMHDALTSLSNKGTPIAPEEHTAALAAALLHDVGHGAFSHTLEHELIQDFHHEAMSRVLLVHLNNRFDGALNDAIAIFDGTYERPWMHQLVSSQLDMDRLDYLRRDAFYTGVAEGEVGVQRLIKTLRVHPLAGGPDARLTVEGKGIYAVENFLISRRLMYWQVYLHKTVLAGDRVLHAALRRARRHLRAGSEVARTIRQGSRSLCFFLEHAITANQLDTETVRTHYCQLDDTDVLFSLKQWMQAEDPVLADLARRFINRDFFRVTFLGDTPGTAQQEAWAATVRHWLLDEGLSTPDTVEDDLPFYLHVDRSRHAAYATNHDPIAILDRSGTLRELSKMADTASIAELNDTVVKPYVSYPKSAGVVTDEEAG
ncbi:MAG: HD domain-containing protein [Longimonas sp.]